MLLPKRGPSGAGGKGPVKKGEAKGKFEIPPVSCT